MKWTFLSLRCLKEGTEERCSLEVTTRQWENDVIGTSGWDE